MESYNDKRPNSVETYQKKLIFLASWIHFFSKWTHYILASDSTYVYKNKIEVLNNLAMLAVAVNIFVDLEWIWHLLKILFDSLGGVLHVSCKEYYVVSFQINKDRNIVGFKSCYTQISKFGKMTCKSIHD